MAAGAILMMSSDELLLRLEEEAQLNPALEMVWDSLCPTCGRGLTNGACWFCRAAGDGAIPRTRAYDDPPLPSFPSRDDGDGNGYDPLENFHRPLRLQEHVLSQAGLTLSGRDLGVAEHLVAELNDNGLWEGEPEEAAQALAVEVETVERVLSHLQSLDPSGVCARSPQESALIQLRDLARETPMPEHAERILSDHWRDLANHSYEKIARAVGITPAQVEHIVGFIRENLCPYPGRMYRSPYETPRTNHRDALRPDVVIRRELADYLVEVVRPFDFELKVSEAYRRLCSSARGHNGDSPEYRLAIEQYHRATWLVQSLALREETLRQIAEHVVAFQRPFLDTGLEEKLKPMTRTEVAHRIGKHVSTVSRATTSKFVLLPDGNLVLFDKFFAPAIAPKTVVAELLAKENPDRPLTDEQICHILRVRGFRIARRTVAKYRLALRLPSSVQRGRH